MTEHAFHLNPPFISGGAEGEGKAVPGHDRFDHLVDVFPQRIRALDATVFIFDAATLAYDGHFFLHLGKRIVVLLLGLLRLEAFVHRH